LADKELVELIDTDIELVDELEGCRVIVLNGDIVVEADRLLESENNEDDEVCNVGVFNGVSDPEVVELILDDGADDGTDELEGDNETELVVEPVGDNVEEGEGCRVGVLNGD